MLQRFYTHTPLLFTDVHLHFMIKIKEEFAFQIAQSSFYCISIWLFFSSRIYSQGSLIPFLGLLVNAHTRLSLWMLQKVVDLNLQYCVLYMVYTFLSYHKYLSSAPFLPCLRVPLVIFSLFREWLLLMRLTLNFLSCLFIACLPALITRC